MNKIEQVEALFKKKLEAAQAQISLFCKALEVDPATAMENSLKQYRSAAWVQVSSAVLADIRFCREDDREMSVECLQKSLRERAMHKAAFPARSTNPTSNLFEQELVAVLLDAAERLNSY